MGSCQALNGDASLRKKARLSDGIVSQTASVQIIKVLWKSCELEDQAYAMTTLCDLVESNEECDYIEELIEAGVVKRLVDCLKTSNNLLNVKAAKILIKFLSGTSEQTAEIVNAGVIPPLVHLTSNTNDALLASCCLQCLAKISHEIIYEDLIFDEEIMASLYQWANHCVQVNRNQNDNDLGENSENTNSRMASQIVFIFNDLCTDSIISAHLPSVLDFLPVLSRIIVEFFEIDILQQACEALVSLTHSTNHSLQAVIDSGVTPRLVELLLHSDTAIATAALGTIANIASGIETHIQVLLERNVLKKVIQLLGNPDKPPHFKFVEDIYLLIQNLTRGTPDQIQQVIDAELLPGVIKVVSGKEGNLETMMQATVAVSNVARGGIQEQVEYMVELGALEALCHQLSPCSDSEVIEIGLDALDGILESVQENQDKVKVWGKLIEDCGGLRQIEICQFHENLDIYQKAHDFIDKYFDSQLRKVRIKATYIDVE